MKTYADIKTFVENKLDLLDEDFITDDELLEYAEEGLKDVEAEIHKLNIEDQYFESQSVIPLVSGRDAYTLPSNIYANKVTRLVYSFGTLIWPIERDKRLHRYEHNEADRVLAVTTNGSYAYRFVNLDPRVGTKVRFFPTPAETSGSASTTGTLAASSTAVTAMGSTSGILPGWFVSGTGIAVGTRVESITSATGLVLTDAAYTAGAGVTLSFYEPRVQVWYIRHVQIPTATTDYIDIPEFWHVVAQHIVVNCLKKEIGNPRLSIEQISLESMQKQMTETLTNMVPDGDDEIEPDYGHYIEQGADF